MSYYHVEAQVGYYSSSGGSRCVWGEVDVAACAELRNFAQAPTTFPLPVAVYLYVGESACCIESALGLRHDDACILDLQHFFLRSTSSSSLLLSFLATSSPCQSDALTSLNPHTTASKRHAVQRCYAGPAGSHPRPREHGARGTFVCMPSHSYLHLSCHLHLIVYVAERPPYTFLVGQGVVRTLTISGCEDGCVCP